ncbi:MAG: hypothetical protein RL662_1799 [Bacteroidota bacterium]|jgi:hypothetical protein
MKTRVFVILLSFFVMPIYGQSMLGVRGAFNMSSLTTGEVMTKLGFNLGSIYSMPITDQWYFQPSLLVSLNGSKSISPSNPHYSAYTYGIETPIIFSYRFGDEDLNVGLDIGVYTRYGFSGGYWIDSKEGRIKPKLYDYHKRFDVGPQAGFSIIVNKIYIGYSFQFGLIKPWEIRKGNYYTSSINLGYLFELN